MHCKHASVQVRQTNSYAGGSEHHISKVNNEKNVGLKVFFSPQYNS